MAREATRSAPTLSRLTPRLGQRGVSALGVIAGLLILLVGIVVFVIGFSPGWLGLTSVSIMGLPAAALDVFGLLLVVVGGLVIWRC